MTKDRLALTVVLLMVFATLFSLEVQVIGLQSELSSERKARIAVDVTFTEALTETASALESHTNAVTDLSRSIEHINSTDKDQNFRYKYTSLIHGLLRWFRRDRLAIAIGCLVAAFLVGVETRKESFHTELAIGNIFPYNEITNVMRLVIPKQHSRRHVWSIALWKYLSVFQCKSETRVMDLRRARVCIAHTADQLRRDQPGIVGNEERRIHYRNSGRVDFRRNGRESNYKQTIFCVVVRKNCDDARRYSARTRINLFPAQAVRILDESQSRVESDVEGNGFADVIYRNDGRYGYDRLILHHGEAKVTSGLGRYYLNPGPISTLDLSLHHGDLILGLIPLPLHRLQLSSGIDNINGSQNRYNNGRYSSDPVGQFQIARETSSKARLVGWFVIVFGVFCASAAYWVGVIMSFYAPSAKAFSLRVLLGVVLFIISAVLIYHGLSAVDPALSFGFRDMIPV